MIKFLLATCGVDASKQINLNYHTDKSGSYLMIKKEDDSEYQKYEVRETLWSTLGLKNAIQEDSFTISRYVCNIELDNLESNTKYLYYVVSGCETSDVQSFTTASGSDEWSFNVYVDFQHRDNLRKDLIINKMQEMFKENTLSICTGDMMDIAASEAAWDWFFNNDMFKSNLYMTSPGDHEYWGSAVDGHYPQLETPYTFNALLNNPKNGLYKNSNYYFYYNNVLFIALDCLDSDYSSGKFFIDENEWLKETLKKLKGTYDFVIVLMHKNIYGAYNTDRGVVRNMRPLFHQTFELNNVDLVISGHDHMFNRTYQIYDEKVSNENKGTYYMDMGSSGNKWRDIDPMLISDGLHEKVIDTKKLDYTCASNIIVSKSEIKVNTYNQYGDIIDSFTIEKKERK